MSGNKVLRCAPTLLPELPRFLPYGTCFPLGTVLFSSHSFSFCLLLYKHRLPSLSPCWATFRGAAGLLHLRWCCVPATDLADKPWERNYGAAVCSQVGKLESQRRCLHDGLRPGTRGFGRSSSCAAEHSPTLTSRHRFGLRCGWCDTWRPRPVVLAHILKVINLNPFSTEATSKS